MFLQLQRLCRCDRLRTGGGEGILDCLGGPQTPLPGLPKWETAHEQKDCRGTAEAETGGEATGPGLPAAVRRGKEPECFPPWSLQRAPPCWPRDFSPRILTLDGWPPVWERTPFCCLKSSSVWRLVTAAPGGLWRSGDTRWGHSSRSRGPTCPGNREGQGTHGPPPSPNSRNPGAHLGLCLPWTDSLRDSGGFPKVGTFGP